MAGRYKKQWLTKKGVEKIQEEYQQQAAQLKQAITDQDNQIQIAQYEYVGQQGKFQRPIK